MAKPCKFCVELLKKAVHEYGFNIKKVSYSLDDGTFESCSVKDLYNDYIPAGARKIIHRGGLF